VWLPDPSLGYRVRGAYSLLTSQVSHVDDYVLDLVWHKHVPLKVSVFERNNRLFNNVVTLIPCLLYKIKKLSLGWLKAKKATFVYGTQ